MTSLLVSSTSQVPVHRNPHPRSVCLPCTLHLLLTHLFSLQYLSGADMSSCHLDMNPQILLPCTTRCDATHPAGNRSHLQARRRVR